jgi:hypothetical protein
VRDNDYRDLEAPREALELSQSLVGVAGFGLVDAPDVFDLIPGVHQDPLAVMPRRRLLDRVGRT